MADNVDDLINQLNEATESDQREEQKPEAPKPTDQPAANPTDFEPGPEPAAAKPVEAFTPDRARATANTWLKWFNSLLKISFPYLYKKTVLRPGDQERMAQFVRSNAGKSEREMETIISSDDTMWPVKTRFDKYLKACEEIELSQDEINHIAEPLAELIVKYRWMQLSPEWSLVIAVCIVMLPRFEPMIPNLAKVFNAANNKASQ